jgi:hypothetical protein
MSLNRVVNGPDRLLAYPSKPSQIRRHGDRCDARRGQGEDVTCKSDNGIRIIRLMMAVPKDSYSRDFNPWWKYSSQISIIHSIHLVGLCIWCIASIILIRYNIMNNNFQYSILFIILDLLNTWLSLKHIVKSVYLKIHYWNFARGLIFFSFWKLIWM